LAAKKPSRAWPALEWAAVVLLGGLLGSAVARLGAALLGEGPAVGFVTRTWALGLAPPSTLDLRVVSLTLGFTIDVGLLTLVGAAASALLYVRLR